MANLLKMALKLLLLANLPYIVGCQSNGEKSPTLVYDKSSTVKIDTVFPNTSSGNLIREHLKVSMGHGEDAETRYQQSLTALRAEPEAAKILYDGYKKVEPSNYLYRTLIVEALKQLRSSKSLSYLTDIAQEKIPANRHPENAEINTREDEVVIRITAVEGITLLATDKLIEADKSLLQLIGSEDLTVRQMATRGYLQSPSDNIREKMQSLRERLPKEEHWYITTDTTDIKKVAHPDMPAKFDIETKKSNNRPKIKEK